jgi:hypothetical protein
MPFDERWLADVLARGQVRVVGGGEETTRGGGDAATRGGAGTPAISERSFMQAIRREALAHGYLFYHTFDSRKSAPGFVDCVLAKPGRPLLMWELKTADGIVTLAQQRWVDVLSTVTSVEAGVYRPEDWETLVARLRS